MEFIINTHTHVHTYRVTNNTNYDPQISSIDSQAVDIQKGEDSILARMSKGDLSVEVEYISLQ